MKYLLLLFALATGSNNVHAQSALLPKFDRSSMQFTGTREQQAKYLLRHVKKNGLLDGVLDSLPQTLQLIFTNHIALPDKGLLQLYLDQNHIQSKETGGSLSEALSKTQSNITARYFVIHDASTPNFHQASFPGNIDSPSWDGNNLDALQRAANKKAHLFINRAGASVMQNNLNIPWRATKFELKELGVASRGLFLHFEMIQPRRTASNSPVRDEIAPTPGFSDNQLKRLALLYITASVRKNDWLMPVFHAVLDEGIPDGHDDPQNFDLTKWSSILQSLIGEIQATTALAPASPDSTGTGIITLLPTINCDGVTISIKQEFKSNTPSLSWSRTITLPASGKFVEEAHYLTTSDILVNTFPSTQSDHITDHLERSFIVYKEFDPAITFDKLYNRIEKLWTPSENGKIGEGSVGNIQLQKLNARDELWMMNMMWAPGQRPVIGTKYLVSANGKNVVVIGGFETGPSNKKFIGGVTGEVHKWLGTGNESILTIAKLQDQTIPAGPCNCRVN